MGLIMNMIVWFVFGVELALLFLAITFYLGTSESFQNWIDKQEKKIETLEKEIAKKIEDRDDGENGES